MVSHLSSNCCWARFSPVKREQEKITLTSEHELQTVKMNWPAKYLSQKSISSEVIAYKRKHTYPTDCFTWTTKKIRKYAGNIINK